MRPKGVQMQQTRTKKMTIRCLLMCFSAGAEAEAGLSGWRAAARGSEALLGEEHSSHRVSQTCRSHARRRDVFLALSEHDAAGERKATSPAVLARFVYHYIVTASEPSLGDAPNVWSSVRRPKTKPNCSPVSGIRSSFCFRVAAAGVLAVRELSCRCKCCLEMRWADCTDADAGPWRYLTMQSTAAVAGAKTRGQRQTVSEQAEDREGSC